MTCLHNVHLYTSLYRYFHLYLSVCLPYVQTCGKSRQSFFPFQCSCCFLFFFPLFIVVPSYITHVGQPVNNKCSKVAAHSYIPFVRTTSQLSVILLSNNALVFLFFALQPCTVVVRSSLQTYLSRTSWHCQTPKPVRQQRSLKTACLLRCVFASSYNAGLYCESVVFPPLLMSVSHHVFLSIYPLFCSLRMCLSSFS